MEEEHAPERMPDGHPDPRPALTRRTVITGAAGIVALAAVGVGAFRLLQPAGPGKLVPSLIAAKSFYVAHHGGSADWPEMSMEAYRNSVARGVDALEISLARTSDGVWFGLHDKTLDRTSGTSGFIASEHSWNEVRQHKIAYPQTARQGGAAQPYARVEELIDAFGGSHTIFIDPKWVPRTHYGELLTIMERHAEKPTQTFVAKSYCTGLAWSAVKAFHKPVIGHVIPNRKAARVALSKGASGLMVSGVLEVLE
ncbi:glycerophosphodiester phosphodiesterase [Leifsonia sp. Root112D2]|uniref:glycerophosphodiester phosphodiesterase n=1 Tax=Leifsonia sp. Root112D2 TaxID=1736426 RepID=UPI000AC2C90F|nr:glycerophosphodiester phosphodiesterase family protein [Leifsonia sp. Root112D2]